MESKNNYYTPDIEDIRVGYECEINKSLFAGISEGWHKFTFNEFEQLDILNKNSLKAFRVPYLTKEQIEAEGWEITSREVKKPPYKVDWINAKKGEHTLWINLAMHDSMYMGISDKIYNVFRGQCKDINTFRYICKLINIK